MPKISVRVLPDAATACSQRRRFSSRARSMRRTSAISCRAMALRSRSTAPAGRIEVEQARGPVGGELPRGAARVQVAQQPVKAVDRAAALAGQLVAAIGQQPQDRGVVVGRDREQVAMVQRDEGDAARVDAVGLAAVPARQHPSARRQR